MQVVQQFIRSCIIWPTNSTIGITLIPKVLDLTKVKDYRFIACYTTIHIVIVKALRRRLTYIMTGLVGCSQSSIIKGKRIIDNIILATRFSSVTQESRYPEDVFLRWA